MSTIEDFVVDLVIVAGHHTAMTFPLLLLLLILNPNVSSAVRRDGPQISRSGPGAPQPEPIASRPAPFLSMQLPTETVLINRYQNLAILHNLSFHVL